MEELPDNFEEKSSRQAEILSSENESDQEGDETGRLLRATVDELQKALEESRLILSERDAELNKLRNDLEQHRKQVAKEIVNKTKLAQALDDSHRHIGELEELQQKWQVEVGVARQRREEMQQLLQLEQSKVKELQHMLEHAQLQQKEKEKEAEELKLQLIDVRKKNTKLDHSSTASTTALDQSQIQFLKQAIYHYLTDYHAEEQVRAIVSILDFTVQERKTVYSKLHDRKMRSSHS